MATVHRIHAPERPDQDGVTDRLTRLVRLELELGLTETREVLFSALVAVAIAVPAAVALIASLVVLLAGALAPLFHAPWQHLVISGGAVLVISAVALGWSAYRVRHLHWPRETLTSIQETWRWLGAQLRSRLTSR